MSERMCQEHDQTAGTDDGPGQAAADRDQAAEARDERAEAHDYASEVRDERADERDERAEAREAKGDQTGAPGDRAGALRDRRGGAGDRSQAADDRKAALADRSFAAEERAESFIDALTGAYRREAGILVLEHEVARARRTNKPFTLAFVDAVGLKRINDSRGHSVGDQVLLATAGAIRARLRPYDPIVRYGGDEFLCGLLDMSRAQAAERLSLANADLAASAEQASFTVGLAEFETNDRLEELIARADEALYKERERLRSP